MTLDLLRHGEPEGGRLYRGNLLDDPLTKKGWQQMQASTNGKHWDFIATSPMIRCQAFAQHLSQTLHIEMQVFEPLKEIGFGDWQGQNVQKIGQKTVNKFKQNPVDNLPLGAENLHTFQARVLDAFMQITQDNTMQSVLIVAHAGVIRVIKSHLLHLPIEKMFTMEVISGSCEQFKI
ncbi:Alpha-ribazole-5'-phosphate phosphatase (EC [Bathymodiolus thermophilus thioautotrophic gill symbiont]|uniref:histidine phosphatase family protein n=1 Tax=Bathymodiolus thermophilus thioautotrophic gill symbiont TaxID=2360 RepID=UPI00192ACF99|nr:histidine phosphatase family protein [Bathymodiolus thermophilus thioautotrophic gill symbiont]CAB5501318.1 Alpha-ribazole-5'-phosphate phosphatase (EC [Bathymodiolus thermophilus thioautotrophic gill symbiont]